MALFVCLFLERISFNLKKILSFSFCTVEFQLIIFKIGNKRKKIPQNILFKIIKS
jgi:hypothetical protein